MTRNEAVAIYDSGIWKDWTAREKVMCQLYEERLIMPFEVFKGAMNEALGRLVHTHEYASSEKLEAEFEGIIGAPTLEQTIADFRKVLLQAHVNKQAN